MASTANKTWMIETGPGSERSGLRKVLSLRIRSHRPILQSEKAFSHGIRPNDGNFLNPEPDMAGNQPANFVRVPKLFASQAAEAAKVNLKSLRIFVLYMIF